jgi:hypothetical protein
MSDSQDHLIGLYHPMQWTVNDTSFTEDRRSYLAQLSLHVKDSAFVAEEAAEHEDVSLARKLAIELGGDYHNIDIPEHVKGEIHYVKQTCINDDCTAITDNVDNLYARAWNMVREWHMITAVNNLIRQYDGRKGLIIVGLAHLEATKGHLPNGVKATADVFYTV